MSDSRADLAAAPPDSSGGPFADATATLLDWLARVSDVPVVLGPPVDDLPDDPEQDAPKPSPGKPGKPSTSTPVRLRVWPLEFLREPELRNVRQREPFRFRVRYLLTVAGTHDIAPVLDPVLVAAVTAREVTLVLNPPQPAQWQALRARQRAALVLDVAAQVARTVPEAPMVRSQLRIRDVPLRQLRGQVLGPDDLPLPGVEVEELTTGKRTRTRTDGTFTITAVPAATSSKLRLTVKGRHLLVEATAPTDHDAGQVPGTDAAADSDLLVIHCDLEEL
ncbi:hypothetical protein [Actinopolymorpha pittospori]